MARTSQAVDLDRVRRRELDEILNRRREAGLVPGGDDGRDPNAHTAEAVAGELVGMALSGGGNRSASFNLGLVQAMHQNGLLRQVDYLSTVSGGGYLGACLATMVLHPETSLDGHGAHGEPAVSSPAVETESESAKPGASGNGHAPGSPQPGSFPLAPLPDGRQSPRVQELVNGGAYLNRPLLFLNRYLIGAFLINVVTFSGVCSVAALVAYAYRTLDSPTVIDWLYALGFRGDVGRAFFPAAVGFGLWVVTWFLSYWRRGALAPGRVAGWMLGVTVVAALLAVAALLGTGDIDLTYLREEYGVAPPRDEVNQFGSELQRVLLIILAVAMLPYLRIDQLIRSGTRPKNVLEGWIFAIASRALLYGIPLLIFALIAREDISRFNEKRVRRPYGVEIGSQYEFQPLEFKDWADTWNLITLQAGGRDDPRAKTAAAPVEPGRFALSQRMKEVAQADESIRTLEASLALDQKLPFWKRWLLFAGYLLTRVENPLTEQAKLRVDYRRRATEVCERLNRSILRDPDFHESLDPARLASLGLPEDRLAVVRARVEALREEARCLHDRVELDQFQDWLRRRDRLVEGDGGAPPPKGSAAYIQRASALQTLMNENSRQFAWTEQELARINWSLVRAFYGDRLSDKTTVFARVVLDADQQARLGLAFWAALIFLASACLVNLNATSMHGYYRARLAAMWFTDLPGSGRIVPLARLDTTAKGAPYMLINAAVRLVGRRTDASKPAVDVFLFSRNFCGSEGTGYAPTEHYGDGTFDLANAVALSGGAVTPTQVQNPLLALLLLLSNSRLGQWLPNPAFHRPLPSSLRWVLARIGPVPIRLLLGALRPAEKRDLVFVSDGGHVENLGLAQLLLRRCRVIILSDATCDPEGGFKYLTEVIRRARSERGIQIKGLGADPNDLGLIRVTPGPDDHFCLRHFFVARIDYPATARGEARASGLLVYVKPTLTGDEEADLLRFRSEDPSFPHDPTSDQFYEADKFESYRQLGFHIGERLGVELPPLLLDRAEIGPHLARWVRQAAGAAAKPRPRRASTRPHAVADARDAATPAPAVPE